MAENTQLVVLSWEKHRNEITTRYFTVHRSNKHAEDYLWDHLLETSGGPVGNAWDEPVQGSSNATVYKNTPAVVVTVENDSPLIRLLAKRYSEVPAELEGEVRKLCESDSTKRYACGIEYLSHPIRQGWYGCKL